MTTTSLAETLPLKYGSVFSSFWGKLPRGRKARVSVAQADAVLEAAGIDKKFTARDATSVPSACEGGLDAEIKRYAFVRWLLRTLTASLALNALAVVVLVFLGIAAGRRLPLQLVARPSLKAEAASLFGRDLQVNVDDLLLYLNTVLPLMHRLDDRGAPDLPLLRGLISAHEYEIATAEAARDVALAKKNFIVQSLVLTRVEDVVADNEHGRISAYVRGYLAIIVQSTNRPVVLPYRAEVLLEMSPPSRLNRFPFVLIKREWKINRAAVAWDDARVHGGDPVPVSVPGGSPKTPKHRTNSHP